MKMRLVLLVVGLLMAGVLVAACGDDEDSGGGSETSAQTQTETQTETTTPEGGGTTEGGGGGNASDPQVQQAIDSCKQSVDANPSVSEDVKKDLVEICEKAASGDAKAAQEATKEVCLKLIEEGNLPDAAQEQAKAACEQAAPAP